MVVPEPPERPSEEDDWDLYEEGYPKMSTAFRTLTRQHEAAHAVFRTVLAKTKCVEIQVGGPLKFEQGYTFSLTDNADPPTPMARAVAAMAGPVANAVFGDLEIDEERRWLSRGTTGDYVTAVTVLSGDGESALKAWDIALDLLEALQPQVLAVAHALDGRSRMTGEEVAALISATPIARLPAADGLELVKLEHRQRWETQVQHPP